MKRRLRHVGFGSKRKPDRAVSRVRQVQKQTAHLLSQMGGRIAIRHHGGITPEAELLSL
jgi:hypothetical protein